jgi:hypothetical protein
MELAPGSDCRMHVKDVFAQLLSSLPVLQDDKSMEGSWVVIKHDCGLDLVVAHSAIE